MARLQILWLPPVEKADGARETPFALVVDQCELSRPFRHIVGAPPFEVRSFGLVQAMVDTPPVEVTEFESEQDRWSRFAEQIGARGAFVTYEQVDFVEQDGTGDDTLTVEFDATELGKSVAHAMRTHLETTASTAIKEWVEQHEKRQDGGRA